jgi:hypothetical protein
MSIIEPYIMDHTLSPRPCEYSRQAYLTSSAEKPCFAELILHTRSGEKFLCKCHASNELRDDPTLMAEAVIELSLSPIAV